MKISYFRPGAHPGERVSLARTPLRLALQYGHLPLINYLLASFPPSLGHRNLDPSFPLQRRRFSDIVKIVLMHLPVPGSDVVKSAEEVHGPGFRTGRPNYTIIRRRHMQNET